MLVYKREAQIHYGQKTLPCPLIPQSFGVFAHFRRFPPGKPIHRPFFLTLQHASRRWDVLEWIEQSISREMWKCVWCARLATGTQNVRHLPISDFRARENAFVGCCRIALTFACSAITYTRCKVSAPTVHRILCAHTQTHTAPPGGTLTLSQITCARSALESFVRVSAEADRFCDEYTSLSSTVADKWNDFVLTLFSSAHRQVNTVRAFQIKTQELIFVCNMLVQYKRVFVPWRTVYSL